MESSLQMIVSEVLAFSFGLMGKTSRGSAATDILVGSSVNESLMHHSSYLIFQADGSILKFKLRRSTRIYLQKNLIVCA